MTEGAQHPLLRSAVAMRQLTGCETAADCMAKFLELAEEEGQLAVLTEADCIAVIGGAIDRGNFELAKVLLVDMLYAVFCVLSPCYKNTKIKSSRSQFNTLFKILCLLVHFALSCKPSSCAIGHSAALRLQQHGSLQNQPWCDVYLQQSCATRT